MTSNNYLSLFLHYFFLKDEYPPLPEGISADLKDFLLQCFQKEPMLRSTAAVLLNHGWLVAGQALSAARTATPRSSSVSENNSVDGDGDYINYEIENEMINLEGKERDRKGRGRGGVRDGSRDKTGHGREDGRGGKESSSDDDFIRRTERRNRKTRQKSERKSMEAESEGGGGSEGYSETRMRTSGKRSTSADRSSSPNYISDRERLRKQDREREKERENEREKNRAIEKITMMEKKKEREKERDPLFIHQFISSRPNSLTRDLSDKLSDRICRKPSSFAESVDSTEVDLFNT